MNKIKQKNLIWLWISVVVIAIDGLTKYLALHYLVYDESVRVMPLVNLTLVYNPGAAFSFLSTQNGWQQWLFILIALVISCVIFIWLYRMQTKDTWLAIALSLILGGAIGNLWDRLIYGHVIDFIDVYVKDWHWPVFNVADSAIVIGAIMILFAVFRTGEKERHKYQSQ